KVSNRQSLPFRFVGAILVNPRRSPESAHPMRKNSHHTQASILKMKQHPRPPRRDAIERFEEKVDRNGLVIRPELGPCHIWTGKRRPGRFDYGQFYYKGKVVQAHKFLYEYIN